MHGMGFCCCPEGCDYFTDDFNRGDSSDLGSDWTEDVGDWSIASNQLTVSSADAQVTCGTTHPSSSTKYRVSVLMQGGEEGDELALWINNDPTTRGVIVFHTNGATGRSRLRLFVADVLVGETDIYAPPGRQHYVYLCTDGDHVALGVGGTLYLSAPVTITSSICGLATGAFDGDTPARFDEFKLSKTADDDAACPACGESCTYFAEVFDGDPINQSPSLSPSGLSFVSGSWSWTIPFYWFYDSAIISTSANALALAEIENPSGATHYVRAKILPGTAAGSSGRARLYADYQNADNCLFVAIRAYIDLVLFYEYEFRKRLAGVETLIASLTQAASRGYTETAITVGTSKASAWVSGTCIGSVSHVPTISKAGIGTPNADPAVICGYVILRKHSDSDAFCATPTCPGGLTCSHCSATPTALDVTFASVTSEAWCDFADPGGCLLWNDTFRLDQDPADPCRYVYTAGGTPGACSPHHVVATFKEIGSFVKALDVYGYADAGETKFVWFRRTWSTAPVACSSLSAESIPFQAQNVCAGTPTCSVTAIP